ncbi:MAG: hypothetical protein QM808_05120 [Steroidobacteraceae bacterium]
MNAISGFSQRHYAAGMTGQFATCSASVNFFCDLWRYSMAMDVPVGLHMS